MRVYEGQAATLLWEYSDQLGGDDDTLITIYFYYAGYKSGADGDYILSILGDQLITPAAEYKDRITYTRLVRRAGFILEDILEADVTGGRYSIEVRSRGAVVSHSTNDDAINFNLS